MGTPWRRDPIAEQQRAQIDQEKRQLTRRA
jgi:hypothetical protein